MRICDHRLGLMQWLIHERRHLVRDNLPPVIVEPRAKEIWPNRCHCATRPARSPKVFVHIRLPCSALVECLTFILLARMPFVKVRRTTRRQCASLALTSSQQNGSSKSANTRWKSRLWTLGKLTNPGPTCKPISVLQVEDCSEHDNQFVDNDGRMHVLNSFRTSG